MNTLEDLNEDYSKSCCNAETHKEAKIWSAFLRNPQTNPEAPNLNYRSLIVRDRPPPEVDDEDAN